MKAQWINPEWLAYIRQFKDIAMDQQDRHRIPASITLAQGILESGAGKGRLARIANNHFGIKCHDWRGPSVRHDDDLRQECFRKYESAEESYEDHSLFLTSRPRYAGLFKLDVRDYKGWAVGLSRAGYATDKSYANKLITIIENYELYEYDYTRKMKPSKRNPTPKEYDGELNLRFEPHPVYITNGMLYVIARSGDNLKQLAKELRFSPSKLAKYNEVRQDIPLNNGDIIYLQKKNKKASPPYFKHVVEDGDSMHSISQRYAIRLSSIYKINKLSHDYMPTAGDVLRLR